MPDPFDLARFVEAQDPIFALALAEIEAGEKRSHWMWYVFPQLRGLGRSPTAVVFGIGGLDEARAYLAHAVLGPRLLAATRAALAHRDRSAHAIFGSPDDVKFRSSMTLFSRAAPEGGPFLPALRRFFDDRPDARTLALLSGEGGRGAAR